MQNNYVFLNNSLISFNSLIDQSIFLTAYPAELCSGAEGYRIWHLVISGVHLGQVVGQSQAQSRDNHTANLEKLHFKNSKSADVGLHNNYSCKHFLPN